jgi:hypothetical protein
MPHKKKKAGALEVATGRLLDSRSLDAYRIQQFYTACKGKSQLENLPLWAHCVNLE